MNSPTTPFAMSSHQAIMKCPWQWRQPFLDEKRASRKRKVGDGYFYDPVDPSFVDHLLPGHAKKFCAELLESDEKEQIQLEIQRLMLEKEQRADRLIYDALFFGGAGSSSSSSSASSSVDDENSAAAAAGTTSSRESDPSTLLQSPASATDTASDASRENMALVDSILLMTKSVDESSLLASPKSVSSPLSPLLDDDEDDEHCLSLSGSSNSSSNSTSGGAASDSDDDSTSDAAPLYARAPSLELVSDNLHDDYFASEDSDLLDFPTASASE